MELRPYQVEAKDAILKEWEDKQRTLLVLPTGCGKTVVFADVAKDRARIGRVLILAHREELLTQASDKIGRFCGLSCAVEKAEKTSIGSDDPITVGSVQTLMSEKRLSRFPQDFFHTVIVDEAHHVMAKSYQNVLTHFDKAKVLGVTATPDRGDMKDLSGYFESLAYEYSLRDAVLQGYLSKIRVQTMPLDIDLSSVKVSCGDFKANDIGHALEPYLEDIADEMAKVCMDKHTVVFLPLVSISQEFRDILNSKGFRAAEVNGESKDREAVLSDFESGKYNVLCNSMLLTEGWDCPIVDCIVILRPTKVRSLYCLDEDTEVLTRKGWKKDVDINEEVAAFDLETDSIVYTPVMSKVRRPLYDDEYFCSVKGQSSDIRVTNMHRMVYDNKRHKGWKIKTATEIADMKDGCYIPVSGHGSFSGVPLSDDELRFIGWVMTDGSINKANNAITITQEKHQPWLEEIQKCIDECGFKHNRFERFEDTGYKRSSPVVCWTISKGQPRGRDKHLRGWGALEPYLSKDISPLLHQMTEEQFDIMLEAINLGDGQKQHGKNWTQRSYHIRKGNKTFIENLQILALQRGYRANVTESIDGNGNPIYGIHLKKQSFVKIGCQYGKHAKWIKEKHHNGERCWCVQNIKGTLVTRRNGKVAIVGNCQMVGRGTRLYPGKDHLLILDFLWMTGKHNLIHPADIISKTKEVAEDITEKLKGGEESDLFEMEHDVITERKNALQRALEEASKRRKERKLIDPLEFELSIGDDALIDYVPTFGWEQEPATEKQLEYLEKMQIDAHDMCKGKASMLIDRMSKRRDLGLCTPRQASLLKKQGFNNTYEWKFEEANKMIGLLASKNWQKWRLPFDVAAYTPPSLMRDIEWI